MRLPFVNVFLLFTLFFQLPAFGQTFSLLKDINPGASGTNDFFPVYAGGITYFVADDGVSGNELWKTDGTAIGTVMVKDINPGSESGMSGTIFVVNDILFFSANDGVHGFELWKSDGSESGTVMIKDIKPGPGSGCTQFTPQTGVNFSGQLVFQADDGVTGKELWKSNGTEAGTILIKDINPGVVPSGMFAGQPNISSPFNLTVVNGIILFSASNGVVGDELWRSDGTAGGTVMVKDLQPGFFGCAMKDCITVNGIFYCIAHTGNDYILWKSDGTESGTVALKTMDPNYSYNSWPINVNNTLYFLDEDGLWKSNGTEVGTIRVKQIIQTPKFLANVNGLLYFAGYDNTFGRELWKSDGTTEGTMMVKDINSGTANSEFLGLSKVGNKLVFSVDDGIHGYELWTSDGTESGTQLLQDMEPGSGSTMESLIIEAGNKALAVINTSAYGNELWVASINTPILLPLTFLEFEGSIVNDDGLLQWKTDNETKSASFTLERSIDKNNYKPVGYVNAANTSGIHTYTYKDPAIRSLGAALVYYRIKQVDINGKFTYSRIVALSIDNKSNFVMIYPNPVINDINLTITISQKSKLQWRLVDYSGRILKSGIYDLSAGSTSVSVDGNNLHSGTYFMQLKGTGLQQVIKVIKQ